MERRRFLTSIGQAALLPVIAGCSTRMGTEPGSAFGKVMTVSGPIEPAEMGFTLPHEHLYADTRPIAEQQSQPLAPDHGQVAERILPLLAALRTAGVRTVVDATATHLGRDPALLHYLSVRSGLNVVMPAGVYLAAEGLFIPDYARSHSAEQLAEKWVNEAREGFGDTGVKPGFIKLAVGGGPLTDLAQKVIDASIITHRDTGMMIGTHIGEGGVDPGFNAAAADAIITRIRQAGISPSAWMWIHAQNESAGGAHIRAAAAGAWISLDGFRPGNEEQYVSYVREMHEAGLLDRVLISQDAGWFNADQPDGGDIAPFDPLLTQLIPALRAAGFGQSELDQLFIHNPASAFTLEVRKA